MPMFKKKPVVVEARLFSDRVSVKTALEIADWCGGSLKLAGMDRHPVIDVETLEGTMSASSGDWIINGVKGEFYPCKPDIFNETYELAQ